MQKKMSFNVKVNLTDAIWPRLGYGTWKAEPEDVVQEAVYNAIKAGYRHIDCAATYGNETFVGIGIKKALDENICKREDLWITSKLWNTDHGPTHVENACRRTLNDLGLDYLDLYLIHFPIPLKHVPNEQKYPCDWFNREDDPKLIEFEKVPLSVTWAKMETLVDKKLTRHIGVSNFDLQLLQDLMTYCRIPPITNQIELHLYLQQSNMIRYCEKIGITVTGYSPFGGKSYIELGMTAPNEVHLLDNPIVKRIADKNSKTTAQIALRWAIQRSPIITVVPKSVSADRIRENLNINDFSLSEAEMNELSTLDIHRRYNDTALYTAVKPESYHPIFSRNLGTNTNLNAKQKRKVSIKYARVPKKK